MRLFAFIRQRSFARYVAFDLAEAARQLGWYVVWMDLDGARQQLAALPEAQRPAAAAALRDRVAAAAPDLVVSYGLEAFAPVCADLVAEARWSVAEVTLGAGIACFLFDFGYPFDAPADPAAATLIERLRAPDVGIWCWDAAALADLARLQVPAAAFPMAVNTGMFHLPASGGSPAARDLPIVFSGGPTPERIAALERVAALGLSVYGYDADGWPASPGLRDLHRGLVAERHALRRLYQRARLTVNVTRAHGRASLNMRVFEAMACGCLVLTDQAEAAAALFTPGEHLITYDSLDDLEAKARRYLADEAARRRIAEAGAREVAARHSYTARLGGIAEPLRLLVREARAWPLFLRYRAEDPARAARFLAALRAEGLAQRLNAWPVVR